MMKYEYKLKICKRKTENGLVLVRVEEGLGKDGLGVWDQQMQTIMYRTDKQQTPTA